MQQRLLDVIKEAIGKKYKQPRNDITYILFACIKQNKKANAKVAGIVGCV